MADKFFSRYTGDDGDLNTDEGLNNQPKSEYVWDDWSFPVTNLRQNAVTFKPDFDQDNIEYLFDPSDDETLIATGISSHTFKLGEIGMTWRPHVHWVQEAVGRVVWLLEYKLWPANTLEPSTWIAIESTDDEFTWNSGSLHQITIFPYIDASGFDSTAVCGKFKITRLGTDTGDTYAIDARFLSFDIHVPIDQLGSRQEFIK